MAEERKHRGSFSKQFTARTAALIRSSNKVVPQVCRDLDLAESLVRRWIAQADRRWSALGGWAWLDELHAREEWRSRGIGGWLTRQAVAWARLGRCDRAIVRVGDYNAKARCGPLLPAFWLGCFDARTP